MCSLSNALAVTESERNQSSHLVVIGRGAAEIVERPVAGRLCGENPVLYAHASLPSCPSVADRAGGTQRTSAICQKEGSTQKCEAITGWRALPASAGQAFAWGLNPADSSAPKAVVVSP